MNLLKCGLALALFCAATLGLAPVAHACGGLFCDTTPNLAVNQTAERIVFVHHDDGTMTAIIEILYEGPTDEFAWVIPAPTTPTVDVSSADVLDRLQAETNPQYQINVTTEGTCGSRFGGCGMSSSDSGAAFPSGADGGIRDDGISVEGGGIVGPYEWVSISVDPMTPDPADVAVDWLQTSGYQVNDLGRQTLGPYLAEGQVLLAFRLTKQSDAGSIRPVQLRYESPCPAIPLRPTAVAAADDMGILVWVFGPSRAVPLNYLGLELNEARINWFSAGPSYDAAVTDAANAAGGRGFVTELAAKTEDFPIMLPAPLGGADLPDVPPVVTDFASALEALRSLSFAYGASTEVQAIVDAQGDESLTSAYQTMVSCPSCDFFWSFDPALVNVVLIEVYDQLQRPLEEARALFEGSAYVTRLYTTMSADEMTSDPMFDFNPDLEAVSNVHVAEQTIYCDRDESSFTAPWTMLLPQGTVVSGSGRQWPVDADSDMPANFTVVQYAVSGAPIAIQENGRLIEDELASIAPGDSGCSYGGWRRPAYIDLGALGALLLVLVARRGRRTRSA